MPLKVWPNTTLGCNHQSICMPQLQPLCSAALVPNVLPQFNLVFFKYQPLAFLAPILCMHASDHYSDLLLFIFDGELEPGEAHAVLDDGRIHGVRHESVTIVVKQHFQLLGSPSLIEQVDGEVLTLLGQLLVLHLQLVLQPTEQPQLPAQFERGQDRIPTGQGNQRRTCQGTVGVYSRPRVIQTVLGRLDDALDTSALDVVRLLDPISSLQKDLDDLVVVAMGGQDQRGDVWREGTWTSERTCLE